MYILHSIEQALIFFPIVLGVFISYRVLLVTDLSIDGTYVLGAIIFAKTIKFGYFYAILGCALGGACIGVIVSYMQKNDKINSLIVGVLASFMMYPVNLAILGRPNISTLNTHAFHTEHHFALLVMIITAIAIILYILFKSNIGLLLRAFGENIKLLSVLGKNPEIYRCVGLSISGALASISGALFVQKNNFADINMGFGCALIAIGAVVIGNHIVYFKHKDFSFFKSVIGCFLGAFMYFACMDILLRLGISATYLKFALGVILFLLLRNVHQT